MYALDQELVGHDSRGSSDAAQGAAPDAGSQTPSPPK